MTAALVLVAIMNAKSLEQLEVAVVSAETREEAKAKCRSELASGELPRSCFGATESDDGEKRRWLENLCAKRARGAANIDSLRDLSGLSATCRSVAVERRRDLEYRLEETNPIRLFESTADDEE